MVAARGLGHLRKVAVVPRELSRLDDDAAHRRAVAAQVLGHRVDDDVGAVLERPAQVRRGERVVDDERNAGAVRDVGQRGDVADVELRIADRLRIDRLGVRLQRGAECGRIVGVDERRVDAELRERDRELRIGAAVERARGDDVVAVARERQQRHHLRRHAGGGGERRAAAFERRDALLERRDGRIRDARIDVAERLQVEQRRRVVGGIEHERRRLIDRLRARAGRRVRNLAGVQAQGVEAELAVRHARSPSAIRDGPARRDDAGVDARPVEPAHDPRVLDLHAAVLHDVEPRVARDLRRVVVADAELHPQHLRALGDGFARERAASRPACGSSRRCRRGPGIDATSG